MSKKINKAKLKAMGDARVNAICVWHAEKAVRFKEDGNTRMLDLHCNLLDQCAAVLRDIRGIRRRGKATCPA